MKPDQELDGRPDPISFNQLHVEMVDVPPPPPPRPVFEEAQNRSEPNATRKHSKKVEGKVLRRTPKKSRPYPFASNVTEDAISSQENSTIIHHHRHHHRPKLYSSTTSSATSTLEEVGTSTAFPFSTTQVPKSPVIATKTTSKVSFLTDFFIIVSYFPIYSRLLFNRQAHTHIFVYDIDFLF